MQALRGRDVRCQIKQGDTAGTPLGRGAYLRAGASHARSTSTVHRGSVMTRADSEKRANSEGEIR